MDKLISVVVPVFNREQCLKRCVDSIITQTYKHLEIILVDDGSYDNSDIICDEYAQQDDRVVVIHKQNGGLSSARNAGIEMAHGDYIAFVDSDDWLDEKMYAEMIGAALQYQADTVVTGFYRIRGNYMWAYYREEEQVFAADDAIKLLVENTWMKNYSWNKLYKSSLFKSVRYPDGRVFEDIPVTYRLFGKSNKVVMLNAVHYFYYINPHGIVANMGIREYLDYCLGHQERYRDLSNKYEDLRQTMLQEYMRNALLPLLDSIQLKKSENIYWVTKIREGVEPKIREIQKFAESEFDNLTCCGAVGRVGTYRLKLFFENKIDELVHFNQKYMPVYQKMRKYFKRGQR